MWNGNLPRHLFDIGQKGYADAAPVRYPDGMTVIDCALGTNPLGAPRPLLEFFDGSRSVELSSYPPNEQAALRKKLARHYREWGVSEDQFLTGLGSMGVLLTLSRILLRPGTSFCGISPQFTDAVLQGLYNGAEYAPVTLKAPRFAIYPDELLASLERKPAVLYLDRPNNPTGQVLPLADLERIARAAMDKGVWVFSDEAYGDFIPDSESAACLNLPNVVTCRSFSKGWGAAGIRVGYAVARDPELVRLYWTVQPVFTVDSASAAMAEAILEDGEYLERSRSYIRTAKERTMEALGKKPGWTVADTDVRVPILFLSQREGNLVQRLADSGIACEGGAGFFGCDDRSIRLRIPAPVALEEFLKRLVTA